MVGEAMGKSQLTSNNFCQSYRDFQGHEIGLGSEVREGRVRARAGDVVTYQKSLWIGFYPSLVQQVQSAGVNVDQSSR